MSGGGVFCLHTVTLTHNVSGLANCLFSALCSVLFLAKITSLGIFFPQLCYDTLMVKKTEQYFKVKMHIFIPSIVVMFALMQQAVVQMLILR